MTIMHIIARRDWWDRLFVVGMIAKGLDGLFELVGGLLLLLFSVEQVGLVVRLLTSGELSEDPGDFIATHLLHVSQGLSSADVTFAALYLLAHGAVKIVLVVALLLGRRWAYPWMIAVLVLFIGYQVFQIALAPSLWLVLLTVFDVLIVMLTVREYLRHRTPRANLSRSA